MTWRFLLAVAWVAAGGCSGGEAVRPAPPLAFLPAQDGAGAVAVPQVVVARAQQNDGKAPPASALDRPPDRPAGLARGSAAACIRATVNGEAILDDEVRATSARELALARTPEEQTEVLNQALNRLIDREVLYQEAVGRLNKAPQGVKILETLKKEAHKDFDKQVIRPVMKANNLKSEEQLKGFLAEQGISLDMMRRNNERQFISMEYLRFRIAAYLNRVGHTEISEYYDTHPEEFQIADNVQWQDLFIDALKHPSREAARAFAEVLASRVRKGEDFVRLAEEYDNGDSQYRKYEGAGHKRGEIRPPEAEPVLFGLKGGDVAVVEIGSGYHVVRLVKREYAGPMPFDEKVQKQIRDKLRGEIFQREMKRIITELRRKAVVEIATTN
jgi:parvulin-like peptidyl-prolyl isomerase